MRSKPLHIFSGISAAGVLAGLVLLALAGERRGSGDREGKFPESSIKKSVYKGPAAPKGFKAVPFVKPDRETIPPASTLFLPDGTKVKTLNGVKGPVRMVWPAGRPFSPIVEKIIDETGMEWYRHADGSYSTTRMCFRADLGRMDATCQVFNPVKTRKVEIFDGKKKGLIPEKGK